MESKELCKTMISNIHTNKHIAENATKRNAPIIEREFYE